VINIVIVMIGVHLILSVLLEYNQRTFRLTLAIGSETELASRHGLLPPHLLVVRPEECSQPTINILERFLVLRILEIGSSSCPTMMPVCGSHQAKKGKVSFR
jgi:hypothetical protein